MDDQTVQAQTLIGWLVAALAAAWMMRHYTFVAIGDPLSRPFQRADDWWSTDANPYLHSW